MRAETGPIGADRLQAPQLAAEATCGPFKRAFRHFPSTYERSAFRRHMSSAASTSSQARKSAIFGSAVVAFGQTIQ